MIRPTQPAKTFSLDIRDTIEHIMCDSVVQTLHTVFEIKTVLKEISYPTQDFSKRDISGVIAFVQESVEGTLAISYSKDTALKLMSKFYGTEIDHMNDQVTDGVSEITNMIHGIVKEELNKLGFRFTMCLPVVVIGQQHYVFSTVTGSKILAEFHTLFGPVYAELVTYHQ